MLPSLRRYMTPPMSRYQAEAGTTTMAAPSDPMRLSDLLVHQLSVVPWYVVSRSVLSEFCVMTNGQ